MYFNLYLNSKHSLVNANVWSKKKLDLPNSTNTSEYTVDQKIYSENLIL